MVERTFTVTGQLGLHARAAAKLVRVASGFESALWLERTEGGRSADAKSILSVLMLAASSGTELRAIAEGPDEEKAIDELGRLFTDGFGETEHVAKPAHKQRPEMRWKGLGVS
ncbi:MAG TPA: HPr family phosphocarrier protein, partial [Pyrinomonadaceae bacterium]|nr:HPr family phosphocarrier protein [Pyrinomonadaceae bacterium]